MLIKGTSRGRWWLTSPECFKRAVRASRYRSGGLPTWFLIAALWAAGLPTVWVLLLNEDIKAALRPEDTGAVEALGVGTYKGFLWLRSWVQVSHISYQRLRTQNTVSNVSLCLQPNFVVKLLAFLLAFGRSGVEISARSCVVPRFFVFFLIPSWTV